MRDIKFRAWDRLCKCYWYQGFAISPDGRVENLHGDIPKARIQAGWTIDKSYDSNLTGFDLEEFTGLKDKNGVEIFEGDILAESQHMLRSVVQWSDSDLAWSIGENWPKSQWYDNMEDEFEVINTIHDEDKKEINP